MTLSRYQALLLQDLCLNAGLRSPQRARQGRALGGFGEGGAAGKALPAALCVVSHLAATRLPGHCEKVVDTSVRDPPAAARTRTNDCGVDFEGYEARAAAGNGAYDTDDQSTIKVTGTHSTGREHSFANTVCSRSNAGDRQEGSWEECMLRGTT